MAQVTLNRLTKHFDDTPVVKGISLTVADGEFFSLLGPSGCGKTTILRMIAGFIFPTAGTVLFDDQDVTHVSANRRNTGMVFQNYALFPHMTVFENVAFGLRTRKVAAAETSDRVARALDLVGLAGLEQRPVPQLSGGQQQRVALARAVVIEPDLLLLDEPLSNLDAKLREETRDQIRELQTKLGITAIYVTHDQEEALAVSDRIAVMEEGECRQLDRPDTIYRRPANRFVAAFMGNMNLWEGMLETDGERTVFRHASGLAVALPEPRSSTSPADDAAPVNRAATTDSAQADTAALADPATADAAPADGPICLALHPQAARLTDEETEDSVGGVVTTRRFKGATVEFTVDAGGVAIQVVENAEGPMAARQPGDAVRVRIPGDQAIILRD
ncbi:MAG: ABC transporter ATP-binding protein [Gemmatimonadetes bacterium]|nr:ABC transporter ATP-binding protein [Gemmatimonadota bacterium]MYH19196.1 ABC transporter ATP-binding protein [Gemmatimonadota bacterium]MYK99225.1 ABC transporter ATP-binding protein [Gemmatimonadota bacterium]